MFPIRLHAGNEVLQDEGVTSADLLLKTLDVILGRSQVIQASLSMHPALLASEAFARDIPSALFEVILLCREINTIKVLLSSRRAYLFVGLKTGGGHRLQIRVICQVYEIELLYKIEET